MKKKLFIIAMIMVSCASVYAASVSSLEPVGNVKEKTEGALGSKGGLDVDTIYYPNANIKSAIAKYKGGNYSGCLQELFSLVKKDPSNALAYYYMAMAFTHVDMKEDAIEAYDRVLALNSNQYLVEYATKGRDCLTGGPTCPQSANVSEGGESIESTETTETPKGDSLDEFINSPYGNGLSPELNEEIRKKDLSNIKDSINKKDNLEIKDIEKIKEYDLKHSKSSVDTDNRVAQVSDEEILNAIKTLKNAGLTVNLQSGNDFGQYQDPQMAELSMMLGNYNNNNNNNFMNMMPFMISQSKEGKNIDPRLMQAMLMNSMMSDFGNNNNNNRY